MFNNLTHTFYSQDHIKDMPNVDYSGVDFIRSPTKQNRSACHQMQHLFIQGVRNLLQLLPGHVKNEEIKKIITCMLEVRLISSVYTC